MSQQNSGVIEFVHPSTMLVAGPTGCGKSHFVVRLLDEHMYDKPIDKVYWYYREWQPLFEQIARRHGSTVEFIQYLPSSFDHLNTQENNLIVIDDLMTDSGESNDVLNLYGWVAPPKRLGYSPYAEPLS
jgi:DNA replication protein DnaC